VRALALPHRTSRLFRAAKNTEGETTSSKRGKWRKDGSTVCYRRTESNRSLASGPGHPPTGIEPGGAWLCACLPLNYLYIILY